MKQKGRSLSLLFFLGIAWVMVRVFEGIIFYDPLIEHFKNPLPYSTPIPKMNIISFWLSSFFRYTINASIGLLIIKIIFQKVAYTRFAFFVLALGFFLIFPSYYYFVNIDFKDANPIGFYVRRLVIQPLLPIILIPALFFTRELQK